MRLEGSRRIQRKKGVASTLTIPRVSNNDAPFFRLKIYRRACERKRERERERERQNNFLVSPFQKKTTAN